MKPSERIKEIYRNKPMWTPETALQSVVDYLDEEWEKQCKHDFVYMSEGDGVGDSLRSVERCRYCGEKRK